MKHSRGPWKAHFNSPTAAIAGHLIKEDHDAEFPIALIWEGGGTHGKPLQLANAHLIAAAPELLKALKDCLPVIDDAEADARFKSSKKSCLRKWADVANAFKRQADAMRAIIAKAEGKTATRKPSTKKR